MRQRYDIFLGSGSPRRRELLSQANLRFTVRTADVDEATEERDPEKVVLELSGRKADAVQRMLESELMRNGMSVNGRSGNEVPENEVLENEVPGSKMNDGVIVTADTIVALEGEILGKPKDSEDACRMLRELSGRTHHVYTGVTVLLPMEDGRRQKLSFSECTGVTFYELTEDNIRDYVESGEPMDKAGSYGIQGLGARFVEKIEGDYNNVVGFPLARFLQVLTEAGVILYEGAESGRGAEV